MEESEHTTSVITVVFLLFAIVCLGGWTIAWRAGGCVAWILGPLLLAIGGHLLVLGSYLFRTHDLDFNFRGKEVVMFAISTIVGVWLGHILAPAMSLIIWPLYNIIETVAFRATFEEAKEWTPAPVMGTLTAVGEMIGYLASRW